jgi:hypothetical protein
MRGKAPEVADSYRQLPQAQRRQDAPPADYFVPDGGAVVHDVHVGERAAAAKFIGRGQQTLGEPFDAVGPLGQPEGLLVRHMA